jgi:hypothetical protein
MHSKFRDTMDQNSFTAPLDAWPMVEQALLVKHAPDLVPLIDEQARQEAERVEARTGLPRTANGAPDSSDREMARALVDAGYMPLAPSQSRRGAWRSGNVAHSQSRGKHSCPRLISPRSPERILLAPRIVICSRCSALRRCAAGDGLARRCSPERAQRNLQHHQMIHLLPADIAVVG